MKLERLNYLLRFFPTPFESFWNFVNTTPKRAARKCLGDLNLVGGLSGCEWSIPCY